jgi:HEAT repeat protein
MAFQLRDTLSKRLQLILLLVLTQTLLLGVVSGQEPDSGKAKAGSEKTPVENKSGDSQTKKRKTRGTGGRATTLIAEPMLVGPTELVPRSGAAPAEDPETVIFSYPCKGETPGNVLGVSEQWEMPARVAGFIKKLDEPVLKTRACAAKQLGYLGPDAKDAVPHLIKLVYNEKNKGVWIHVEKALWEIGPGRPFPELKESKSNLAELVELSKSPDVYVRLYATFTLGYYKPVADQKVFVAALIAATSDQDNFVRWMALTGLGRLGPIAKDAVPVLLQSLKSENPALRERATIALGGIGPDAAEAAPALLKQMENGQDYRAYYDSVFALAHIGPTILPLLEPAMKIDPFKVLDILEHMRPGGAPLVIEAMHSKNKEVQKKAIKIIGWFGQAAEPAVPLLIAALKDPDRDIRVAAGNSLEYLGPVARAAVPALTAALNDKDDLIQCTAATALGGIGPNARSAVPELQRLLNLPVKDTDFLQRCAAKGLMEMSPETRALVPADLIKSIDDETTRRRLSILSFATDATDETRPKPKPKPKSDKKPSEIY